MTCLGASLLLFSEARHCARVLVRIGPTEDVWSYRIDVIATSCRRVDEQLEIIGSQQPALARGLGGGLCGVVVLPSGAAVAGR